MKKVIGRRCLDTNGFCHTSHISHNLLVCPSSAQEKAVEASRKETTKESSGSTLHLERGQVLRYYKRFNNPFTLQQLSGGAFVILEMNL